MKIIDKNKPKYKVKEKILLRSSLSKSFFCMIAGPIPISDKILKNTIKTVAIATTPKSLGEINLAKTADMKS